MLRYIKRVNRLKKTTIVTKTGFLPSMMRNMSSNVGGNLSGQHRQGTDCLNPEYTQVKIDSPAAAGDNRDATLRARVENVREGMLLMRFSSKGTR